MRSSIPAIAAILVFTPACFVRHRVVPSPGKAQNRPLLTATRDELIARLHRFSNPIQSFNLRADMSPSVGSLYGGELTDYATVRAYILFRRPNDIRVMGLDPVVHSKTIFDMVSTGSVFDVYIPSRNTFYVGDNDAPPSSKNKFENLRPSAFLTSLIIAPPDSSDRVLIIDDTDETKAEYALMMIRGSDEKLHLAREVYFDRYTLQIVKQRTFDDSGEIVSETRYSDWKDFDKIDYPTTIVLRRPKDGYELTMSVIAVKFNAPDITASQFQLEQPAGAKVIDLK